MTTKNIQDVVAEFATHFLKRKYETTMDSDEFEFLIETQQDYLTTTLTQLVEEVDTLTSLTGVE